MHFGAKGLPTVKDAAQDRVAHRVERHARWVGRVRNVGDAGAVPEARDVPVRVRVIVGVAVGVVVVAIVARVVLARNAQPRRARNCQRGEHEQGGDEEGGEEAAHRCVGVGKTCV